MMKGSLIAIIEKTTLLSVKLYGRTDYNCTILGDGKIQHWGVDFDDYPPVTIVLNCVEPSEVLGLSLTQ
jgi:hypothetical protein